MTNEEKINYMRIAAGVCGYGFKNEQLDLLVSIYELILEKKDKGSISDIVDIEMAVKSRTDAKKKSELLNHISEKD